MNRCDLERLIGSEYGVKPDYPWAKYPTFAVFRHKENKKWFAVIMTIDKRKIGIDNDGKINVVNLKRDANFISTVNLQQGVFPAYHMNKEHWLTVLLDGSVKEENIKFLLALSFDLTKKSLKRK